MVPAGVRRVNQAQIAKRRTGIYEIHRTVSNIGVQIQIPTARSDWVLADEALQHR